eukprot:4924256-Pyramimonas_sp.AAC.2
MLRPPVSKILLSCVGVSGPASSSRSAATHGLQLLPQLRSAGAPASDVTCSMRRSGAPLRVRQAHARAKRGWPLGRRAPRLRHRPRRCGDDDQSN